MNNEYKIDKDYIQLLIDNKDKIIHLGENDIRILITYIDVLQQELQRKGNIINELKEWVENELPYLYEIDKEYENIEGNTYFTYKEYDYKKILDKINELEGENE